MDILTQDKINGLAKKHEVELGNERVLPGFFNVDLPKPKPPTHTEPQATGIISRPGLDITGG